MSVERWCDRFAGAFLMPVEYISQALGDKPEFPSDFIDDRSLRTVANLFGVSRHAMLIRLVHLGYVKSGYYWLTKKRELDEEDDRSKGGGRGANYSSRFQSRQGNLYTSLVVEAWDAGLITNHHAAEYMGTDNIQYVNEIRDSVLSS